MIQYKDMQDQANPALQNSVCKGIFGLIFFLFEIVEMVELVRFIIVHAVCPSFQKNRYETAGGCERDEKGSYIDCLLVDLGQDLGVAEEVVLFLADLDGAAAEL
jgi:hypothetical protein